MTAALELRHAGFAYGEHRVWSDLDLTLGAGEVLAVLGPNGAGKTTLVKVLLGILELTEGSCTIGGHAPSEGRRVVGYVPQQRGGGPPAVRGRDLVGFGLDGHRPGLPLRGRRARRARIDTALREVGADGFADKMVDHISGGQLQRLRIAQATVGDPSLLLCDEPLLSLDPGSQQEVVEVIDARRRTRGTAVVLVTHEIDPVLPIVDRVLYLANGGGRTGTVDEVMRTEVLTELYRAPVTVIHVGGRLHVVGGDHGVHHHHEGPA